MSASRTAREGLPRARRLAEGEWASIVAMAGVVLGLHLVGWGALLWITAGEKLPSGSVSVFGVGLGASAYVLGVRHAFDADHIAAIDNTTRRLMHGGARPVSVGFWFSLGHSSIVFGLCALLASGVRVFLQQAGADGSGVHQLLALVGAGISGLFLWIIGILNLIVLIRMAAVLLQMRRGGKDEAALEQLLGQRGLMNRFFGRAAKVARPWQMYFVGLLFGLGFDTATEVGLLVLAGGAAAFALPWYAILTLPVLFAAGMSLFDSLDGCFMNFAYGWALARPARKVFYNLLVTALSVAVALGVGTVELASVLDARAGITDGPLAAIGRIDLATAGYAVTALFLFTWAVAIGIWKFARIEEREAAPRKGGRDTLAR
ncbi:MAG TPA: HoxN/HupN/NixA family nickel/cobalt transporter [Sinomonas sp.]|nr:HoxN/HupN/NixA family nickel/cobalt transporter [Sinomonas sp.]